MKYLETLIYRLEEIKAGINRNNEFWNGTPVNIENHLRDLKNMDKEIADIHIMLSRKLNEARKLRDEKKEEILKLEKRAIGIHADDDSKLRDYNIILKKYFRK